MTEICAECHEPFEPTYRVPDFLTGSMICPDCSAKLELPTLKDLGWQK